MFYYIKKILKVKSFNFKKYPKKKIILFNNYTLNLKDLLDSNDYITIDTSLNSINLRIIFKLIFKLKLKTPYYFSEIIREINPDLVITVIDQNSNFWRLKKIVNNKKIKFAIVQNGWRRDIFIDIKKGYDDFSVDTAFVFNNFIGDLYKKKLNCNYYNLGSLKNNFYLKDKVNKKIDNSLLFINQINPYAKSSEEILFIRGNKKFSWSQFYRADFLILNYLNKYCKINNLKLFILGRNYLDRNKENKLFDSLLKNNNVEYIENLSVKTGYEHVSKYSLAVHVDSTLGYELLCKSTIKTCCFAVRGYMLNCKDMSFGWPTKLDDEGFFWTNRYDENKFEEILSKNLNLETNEWKEKTKHINEKLMHYSDKNKILKDYLKNITKN